MAETQVRFYRFKNRLRERCVGLGHKGPVSISEDLLAQATQQMEQMAEDYPDWVQGLIEKLYECHRRCVDTPEDRIELFKEITAIAHDMKGQGGTFGYELITSFSDSLYGFTSAKITPGDAHVELVKAHIDAMRVVIKDRVKGDGGDEGYALRNGLENAILKFRHKSRQDDYM